MSKHPLTKLVAVIDYKIAEHKLAIENVELKEEALQKKISKGKEGLQKNKPETAVLVKELLLSKDTILYSKGAITALEDIKKVIKDAIK